MANTILMMEAANLFCGAEPGDVQASNHLVLTEVKLPAMDEQFVDHRAGGAPVAIELPTVFARLQCTFALVGWTPQVADLIDSWNQQQNMFWFFGVVRDRQSGEAQQAMAKMTGRLGQADPQNWRRGDSMHWNYVIRGIIQYKLDLAGTNLYDWDFFSNKLIVNGDDRNAITNQFLGAQ